MKIIIFIISFLVLPFITKSQKGITVQYSFQIKKSKNENVLELNCNDTATYSWIITKVTKKQRKANWPLGTLFNSHSTLCLYKQNKCYSQSHLDQVYDITVVDSFLPLQIVSTTEKKEILNYNCTKYNCLIVNNYQYSVWVADSIPFNGSPYLSFDKGLVLECESKDFKITAQSVAYKNVEFAIPNSTYILTNEQMTKALKTRKPF
jgi:GLPGLI family protein